MRYLILYCLVFFNFSFSQTKLDFNAISMNEPSIGEEFIIRKNNGASLINAKYIILSPKGNIEFEIKDNIFSSPIQFFNASNNRLGLEILTQNNIVVEVNRFVNFADESKNVGDPILSKKETLVDNVRCKSVFNENGKLTYKSCSKLGEDDEIYLFQCSVKSAEPNTKYCEEIDYKNNTVKYYKNYQLYKEVKREQNSEGKDFLYTINYDDSNAILEEIYDYKDSIRTVKPSGNYSIEIKEDSRTSSVKVSHYTAYDKKGKLLFTEKREKERNFDGITTLRRIQKNKTIIETYDNNGNLINTNEE